MRLLLLLLLSAGCLLPAQDGFCTNWRERSEAAKAGQPHWMTPLVTVTPRLEQEFRTDFVADDDQLNFGNGKGLELIPNQRVELLFNIPPYLVHGHSRLHDGFGDVSFVGKYRLLAAPEEGGSYIVTLFLGGTIPTGSYTNGARGGVLTPVIAAGKGWGRFDVQSTFGAGLPLTQARTIGHALAWNTALQYHGRRRLWPELEINSTFWTDGPLDGKRQTFLTPGLIVGRLRLHGHLRFAFGGGFQMAVTRYHLYNHAAVFTMRFPF
jgi:hypothetical protein